MNRAVVKLLTSSCRMLPRIYASSTTSATTTTGHSGSGHVHDHGHDHDHHHHEPQLRKTQTWSHHAGIQSKYENQSEDPSMTFMAERPNAHDYRPSWGQVSLNLPYRTQVSLHEMWLYHAALIFSIWLWLYVD